MYTKYRMIDIKTKNDTENFIEYIKRLYGIDIFINDIPVLKIFALSNIIIWLILFGGN